ncbi:MAG: beta-mannosidase [Frankiales bacterium]|nr:beta-mannosidase [Frankiales bacterium]
MRVEGYEYADIAGWTRSGAVDGDDVDSATAVFTATLPRLSPEGDDELVLELDGLATRCELRAEGELLLRSASMFTAHSVPLPHHLDGAELTLTCLPLWDGLPSHPRPRWKTRLADSRLRWVRTTLLGRAPGFAPGPPVVGPWRPARVVRRRTVAVDGVRLVPELRDGDGSVAVVATARGLGAQPIGQVLAVVSGHGGTWSGELRVSGDEVSGEVVVPAPVLWWPHTHGTPALYDVRLEVTTSDGVIGVDAGRVGFRVLGNSSPDSVALRVNDVPVFVRGAVWVPFGDSRAQLEALRAAGLNAVRVAGTGVYEDGAFHDLCDELGMLVWQDLMLANFDYPVVEEAFGAELRAEVSTVLAGLVGRPSLALVCGGSEVEQQAAMVGLDPSIARSTFIGEEVPALVGDAVFVPSAPSGGDLPFHPGVGVANYYGVGGYMRPLSDARTSGVRFAAECLAIANVPDDPSLPDANVPRDRGSGWDFADVRDHYARELFGVDPVAMREGDPDGYLELSREVSAHLMAEVFGEWRRTASPSGGGFVLWARDLLPGSGWGLLDHAGKPKRALEGLRQVCAPVAIWTVDEGLGGVDIHIANDTAVPVRGAVSVELLRGDGVRLHHGEREVEVPPREVLRLGVEQVLGGFVDASYAYRFGPREHDSIEVTLSRAGHDDLTARRAIR